MNSKERVACTINHQEPDRVPVGEWGIDHDHVSKIIGHHTYWRNRKDTTLALWDNRRDEVVESLKKDCVELVEKLDYDIITVELVPPKNHWTEDSPRLVSEGVCEDKKGNCYKYASSNDSIMWVPKEPPEGKFELSQEDIDSRLKAIEEFDESRFELVDYIGDRFGKEKAVLFRDIDIYYYLCSAFGGDYNHQLVLSLMCPEEITRLYDACFAYNKKLLEHCKEHNVMISMQGHDYGMNSGCIMRPDSIRELFMPMMKRVNQESVRQGIIPFYHCCGNIWEIMDDFVGAGYRGYQSIQESAGMDTERVKELYGKDLTLWTGIQCETLITKTMEEAGEEVEKNLKFLMPGGGFIFGSTNSVQYGAKTDNYLKALDVVRTKGVYR